MIGYFFTFIIGFLVGFYIRFKFPKAGRIKPFNDPKSYAPEYSLSRGEYTQTTKCDDCHVIFHSLDQFEFNPCQLCGSGNIKKHDVMIYTTRNGVRGWHPRRVD